MNQPVWVLFEEHISRNAAEYMTFVAALSIAFVCTWPERIPASLQDWWTWLRNAFQTAIPAARNHQNPISPGNPAKPESEKSK